jgi:hypothetical protein
MTPDTKAAIRAFAAYCEIPEKTVKFYIRQCEMSSKSNKLNKINKLNKLNK